MIHIYRVPATTPAQYEVLGTRRRVCLRSDPKEPCLNMSDHHHEGLSGQAAQRKERELTSVRNLRCTKHGIYYPLQTLRVRYYITPHSAGTQMKPYGGCDLVCVSISVRADKLGYAVAANNSRLCGWKQRFISCSSHSFVRRLLVLLPLVFLI